jgi:hypothetical protein
LRDISRVYKLPYQRVPEHGALNFFEHLNRKEVHLPRHRPDYIPRPKPPVEWDTIDGHCSRWAKSRTTFYKQLRRGELDGFVIREGGRIKIRADYQPCGKVG